MNGLSGTALAKTTSLAQPMAGAIGGPLGGLLDDLAHEPDRVHVDARAGGGRR